MNYAERVKDLINAPDDDTLVIAGRTLRVDGDAAAWRDRLHSTLAHRLYERRPNGTEHTWRHFVTVLKDYVRHVDRPSETAIQDLITLVDSL